MSAGCPPWCDSGSRAKPLHARHASRHDRADGAFACLVMARGWDKPELLIRHDGQEGDGLLVPLAEVAGLASLLAALGHAELAATVAAIAHLAGAS